MLEIGVAHNGNLTNSIALKQMIEDGAILYCFDTETIVQLIAKSKEKLQLIKLWSIFQSKVDMLW